MQLSLNVPALLFPAISLIMLAYTNRFLGLASLVRSLKSKYELTNRDQALHLQIKNLRYRLRLIKNMQAFGVLSFACCLFSMLFVYLSHNNTAEFFFGFSLLFFLLSLLISLLEIQLSTKALELELSSIEDMSEESLVTKIKKKFEH